MKINKKMLQLAVFLLAALLSACGSTGTSSSSITEHDTTSISSESKEKWDEQVMTARCSEYMEMFRNGQFDSLYAHATNELKTQLPQETLAEQWNSAAATARVYSGNQTEQFLLRDGKAEVLVTSVHSRYNLQTSFTFLDENTVDALSIDVAPLNVAPESSDFWEEFPITVGYDAQKPLNGMLTLPKNVESPSVAILVQGSGANGMDSLIGTANNRPFADLAHGLAERGIAVIRYDKRSYTYPQDVADVETEYLRDVKAAVRFALEDSRVNGKSLYLIGHSQGGMLAPIFAKENPEIQGIASLGGTLLRLEDKVLEQTKIMMEQNTELTQEQKNTEIARVKAEADIIKSLTPESTEDRNALLLNYPVSYWISLNAINPEAIAKELSIPILILQGDNDFQVTYENDFLYWQQVLSGKENVQFQHYAGLSHVFMPGSRERFDGSAYNAPATMDTQVIQDIANWIQK